MKLKVGFNQALQLMYSTIDHSPILLLRFAFSESVADAKYAQRICNSFYTMGLCAARIWPFSEAATLWRGFIASTLNFYSADISTYRKQKGNSSQQDGEGLTSRRQINQAQQPRGMQLASSKSAESQIYGPSETRRTVAMYSVVLTIT